MDRKIATTIFVIIAIGINLLMHLVTLFAWSKIARFGIEPYMIVLASALSVLFVLANILERAFDGPAARILYIAAASWLGMTFIAFNLSILALIASAFFKVPWQALGIATIATWAWGFWSAASIQMTKLKLKITGLKTPLRIVHLSDMHLGAVNNKAYAAKIASIVNSQKPDFVVLTGDLSDGSGDFSLGTIKPLDSIKAPIYYVNGNHENYLGLAKVLSIVRKTKIKILEDRKIAFKGVDILGFSYPMEGTGTPLSKRLSNVRFKSPSILLYHAPEYLDAASKAGVDLYLCGHVHGGQIVPFNLLVRLVYPFSRGTHDMGNMKVVVSQGIGTWGPPMRIGSRSEILVIDLH